MSDPKCSRCGYEIDLDIVSWGNPKDTGLAQEITGRRKAMEDPEDLAGSLVRRALKAQKEIILEARLAGPLEEPEDWDTEGVERFADALADVVRKGLRRYEVTRRCGS